MVHQLFGIQCPTIFCDFGLFNSLAQAGGGGAYYMIFHYQKHTVLNYLCHNEFCFLLRGQHKFSSFELWTERNL